MGDLRSRDRSWQDRLRGLATFDGDLVRYSVVIFKLESYPMGNEQRYPKSKNRSDNKNGGRSAETLKLVEWQISIIKGMPNSIRIIVCRVYHRSLITALCKKLIPKSPTINGKSFISISQSGKEIA
jgi:hypothetical protein